MTPEALADLRALAEAAAREKPTSNVRTEWGTPDLAWQRYFGDHARYLDAVSDPDVVLALLERAERAEAVVEAYRLDMEYRALELRYMRWSSSPAADEDGALNPFYDEMRSLDEPRKAAHAKARQALAAPTHPEEGA